MAKEILIAASDKADQEEFQRIFETKDYRLIFSETGEEALLRVKLFKPDLIIAGLGLKEKTGFELCEDIKADQGATADHGVSADGCKLVYRYQSAQDNIVLYRDMAGQGRRICHDNTVADPAIVGNM